MKAMQNTPPPQSTENLLFWRRCSQCSIALLFIILPFLNAYAVHWAYGNFLAFSLGPIPFADPLSVIQVAIITASATATMLIGAALTLMLAFIFGSVFCSWICPFGLLSELLYSSNTPKKTPDKKAVAIQTRWGFGVIVKLTIAIVALIICWFVGTEPFINQVSLPGWYSRMWQAAALQEWSTVITGGWFIVIALLIEKTTKKRIWCRYLCPQSVIISVTRLLSPKTLTVTFAKQLCSCKGTRPCQAACSLGLAPRANSTWQNIACTNCGQCITACSHYGKALSFTLATSKQLPQTSPLSNTTS